MFSRLFGPRITVELTILGLIAGRMVRWTGTVRVRPPADVQAVLRAAGAAARIDLGAALADGAEPNLLLNGRRLEFPAGLATPVPDGTKLAWLTPMAGG